MARGGTALTLKAELPPRGGADALCGNYSKDQDVLRCLSCELYTQRHYYTNYTNKKLMKIRTGRGGPTEGLAGVEHRASQLSALGSLFDLCYI